MVERVAGTPLLAQQSPEVEFQFTGGRILANLILDKADRPFAPRRWLGAIEQFHPAGLLSLRQHGALFRRVKSRHAISVNRSAHLHPARRPRTLVAEREPG